MKEKGRSLRSNESKRKNCSSEKLWHTRSLLIFQTCSLKKQKGYSKHKIGTSTRLLKTLRKRKDKTRRKSGSKKLSATKWCRNALTWWISTKSKPFWSEQTGTCRQWLLKLTKRKCIRISLQIKWKFCSSTSVIPPNNSQFKSTRMTKDMRLSACWTRCART